MSSLPSVVALAALTAAPALPASFSHSDWTTVLARTVDDAGNVDYQGLADDRGVLDRYLDALERQSPDSHPELFSTPADALAYWINAYNAMTFRGVLERGPESESVWGDGIFGIGFFTRKNVVLGGRRMSLKSLEDDIVRARFEDPRVHAALNCASRGCPRLLRKAFEGPTLDTQLDAAMREMVAAPRHVTVDEGRRSVTLSKIFDWFEGDFLAHEKRQGTPSPKVIDYVNRYRPSGQAIPRDFAARFFDYDKRINAQ